MVYIHNLFAVYTYTKCYCWS